MKKATTLIMAIVVLFATTVCIPVLAEDEADPTLVLNDGFFQNSYTHSKLQLKNAPGDDYEYKFIVYNSTSKQWYKLQDYSDSTEINWFTGPAGLKTLYVDIRNKILNEDYRRISLPNIYVTDKGLSVSKFISSKGNELDENSYTTLTAEADKGKSPYQYKFIVHNDRTGQWYRIQDFSSKNTATWYSSGADQKSLYVDVRDSDGTVVRQRLDVVVESNTLSLKSDYEKVLEGEETSITFEATGKRHQTVELFDDHSSIGIMHDDGIDGDLSKDDGVYTLSINMTPQFGEKYHFFAKGELNSNSIEISTYKIEEFLSESESADDILSHIQAIADEYVISDSEEDTLSNAVSTYNKIYDYVTSLKDNNTILDCHFNGLTITIDLPLRSLFYTFEVDPSLLSGSSDVRIDSISTYEPYKSQFNTSVYDDAASSIVETFDSYYISNNADNNEVTLDMLTSLSDNRVIIWNGHGGFDYDHHSYLVLPIQTRVVYGAEQYVTPEYIKYIDDFVNERLLDGGDKIGVTGDFFTHYYCGNNKLKNTLFFVGACAGAYDDYFCKNLLKAGARTVLAYDDTVQAGYNEAICESFFNNLIKKESDNSEKTITAGDAYTRAKKSNIGNDLLWNAVIYWASVEEKVKSHDKEKALSFHEADFVLFGDKDYRLSDIYDDSPNDYGGIPVDYTFDLFKYVMGHLSPGKPKFENNLPESWQLISGNTRYNQRYHDSSLDEFDEQGRLKKATYVEKNNTNRYLTFSRESDYRVDGSYIVKEYNHLAGVVTDYYTYDPNSKIFLWGYWNFQYDNNGRLKRLFAEPGYNIRSFDDGHVVDLFDYDEMVFSYVEFNNSLYRKYCAYKNGEKVYSGTVQIINSNRGTTLIENKIYNRDSKQHTNRLYIPNSFNGQSIIIHGEKIEDGFFDGPTFSYDEKGNLISVGQAPYYIYELSY